MAALFACTKCHRRHPFDELSSAEQLCKECRNYYPIVKCTYCRIEFQQEDKTSTNSICKKCAQNVKLYGKPSACEYCNILAAFIGNKCQRCTNSERKWGAPKTCEQCKQKCAFERTDNSTKVDGKLMCWLCTVAYKRVLAKAKIRQEVSRKNFGSQKKSSEKSEKSEKSEQIDKFDSIMNKTTDENKPGPKTENTSSAVPESQESTGSQDEKSSERKPHKHHKHKHHHHHHHHKHKHHHSQKSSEPNTPTAAVQTPPSKKPRLETNSSTNGVTPTKRPDIQSNADQSRFSFLKNGSSLSSITGLNMSSLTDRPTEDPHSSEHLIALQLLQEQMEGLKKTLQQKEQQLLEKEKKLTELKAQNYESEKEWRIKFTNVQKKLTETNENNQIKVRELMKQISTLSKGGKKLKGYDSPVPSPLAL
ncbi:protein FAM76B-like isoform X1 [Mytilus edulis]